MPVSVVVDAFGDEPGRFNIYTGGKPIEAGVIFNSFFIDDYDATLVYVVMYNSSVPLHVRRQRSVLSGRHVGICAPR